MAIRINKAVLEKACKNIIETILFCLPNAYKGTVYQIGSPPEMSATRITSGFIDKERSEISWGLPEKSDYNPPGKPWFEYRDQSGRALEAMAWCVEKQKSWTAENPVKDNRSVRLQVEGVREDFHHMEPVLVRKGDLYITNGSPPDYPLNHRDQILWRDSNFAVVAVIKIHFRPHTIKIGSPETKIIKRLSRALGTELLSCQLREESLDAIRHLAQDKINSCNILAHSLRNAITKSGLILSLIKLEIGSLRDQWENVLIERSGRRNTKRQAIRLLDEKLSALFAEANELKDDLREVQKRFFELSLPPERGERWVRMQIEERWHELLKKNGVSQETKRAVDIIIGDLKRSLHFGKDPEVLATCDKMPDKLKEAWTDLIYSDTDGLDPNYLEKLVKILEDPSLDLPHQEKSRKSLLHLKTLAEIMGQLEENTNEVLRQVLIGGDEGLIYNALNRVGI